jgi:ATP-dependent exoDNAse (exonuclease V) alpha subunit
MARIITFAHDAHCKVLLLGDPEQLQPIQAGSPFRAILNYVGFFEMSNIQRQHSLEDRKASQNLAQGKIGLAIDHYQHQAQLHLLPEAEAKTKLIDAWEQSLTDKLEDQVILAHKRDQVKEFNLMAREKLLSKNLIGTEHHVFRTAHGGIELATGDRIVFLRNNYNLHVYNGDFATITDIKANEITAKLKDKTVTFNPKEYNDFHYGYAVTIHKSQGTTVKNSFVYIDGQHWDKHLAYVAMTRHQDRLQVFANQDRFQSLDKLKRQLSQSPTRHNVSEYCERMIERNRLSIMLEKILPIFSKRHREHDFSLSRER